MKKEIVFKQTDYEGYYVNSDGVVYSSRSNKIITESKNNAGYIRVVIDGKTALKHRLIAKAFVYNPNPKEFNVVNHIDQNFLNNHISNLEWCTTKHNIQQSFLIGKARLKKIKVKSIDDLGVEVFYDSITDAAKSLNGHSINISRVINATGIRRKNGSFYYPKKAYGLTWVKVI